MKPYPTMNAMLGAVLALASLAVVPTRAQQPRNLPTEPPADFTLGTPDYSLLTPWSRRPVDRTGTTRRKAPRDMKLPDHVHNGQTKYFIPRFNQVGGSCGSAADVCYQFGHETNSYRDRDASLLENQFPSHFTWLLTYHGSDKASLMRSTGVPDCVTYGGFPYSRYFGAQDYGDNDYGVMQGYDRWYKAMFNRIVTFVQSPLTVETEEGRLAIKRWLYNHNGDESFKAGGVCGIGVAAGPFSAPIPSTEANEAAGVVGMQYITSWNDTYNHAMTVVGYDDRLEFDLDGNGVFGEKDKDEVGAWIVCNSWGAGWGDDGFMYCPYKHGGPWLPKKGGFWNMGMYYIRKDYRPLVTLKITLDYSKRSEICLGAGVAADTAATKPERTILFEHFKYAGLNGGKGEDPELPMLGCWADGPHYEPLEFGYDLTDLTDSYDRTQPLRYFFFIDSKQTATGEGLLRSISLMNYEYDREGVEMPFDVKDVQIQNHGKTTMVSLVARGEQLYKPLGLSIQDGQLTWSAPQRSTLPLRGYCIYADGVAQDTIPATQTTYALPQGTEAAYTIAAVYGRPGQPAALSKQTDEVRPAQLTPPTEENMVCKLNKSGFTVPNIFLSSTAEATIEYWLKPASLANYNQAFGPGWGTFYVHATSAGAIYYGWDTSTGNRSASNSVMLSRNKWAHVAITIKNNVMTLYINGRQRSACTSPSFSGLPALGVLNFGGTDAGKAFDGLLDELRIWRTCRSASDLYNNKDIEIANPAAHPDLLAYYKMDAFTDETGHTFLRDCAGGHHASLIDSEGTTFQADASILKGGSNNDVAASIVVSTEHVVAGEAVHLKAVSRLNATSYTWQAPTAGIEGVQAPQIDIIFPTAGEHEVSLTVASSDGEESVVAKTITVEPAPEPVIDFTLATDEIPVGERLGLVNRSQGTGLTFRWLIPDADEPEVEATHATAVFQEMGDHEVTLLATLPDGTERRQTRTVRALGTAPIAQFDISTDVVLKGEPIFLLDHSRYAPTTWQWNVSDGVKQTIISGRNSSYTPLRAGAYSVTLDVANSLGSSKLQRARAFLVASTDPGNGLNFTGAGQKLTFPSPLTSTQRSLTFDFWLRPSKQDCGFSLANEGGQYALRATSKGAAQLTFGGKTITTPDGYFIPGEWHHYVVVVYSGKPTFYRDAEQTYTTERMTSAAQDMTSAFVLGSDDPGMMAHIDELRLWNKALSPTNIKAYCNHPITDLPTAEKAGLSLYYDFNHSQGNPIDRSSLALHGTRTGFGPDGDAWSPSKGVFTLSVGEDYTGDTPVDVTSRYLTNYKRPFYSTSKSVNRGLSIYKEFERGTKRSAWHIENPTPNEEGNIIAGVYVNTNKQSDFCVETGWNSFPSKLTNHLFYHIADLPEGAYRFTANVDLSNGEVRYGNTRLMVARGQTLPSILNYNECIASAEMSDEVQSVDFFLDEPTQVAIGMNINLTGEAGINISSFKVEKISVEFVDADGYTTPDGITLPTPQPATATKGYHVLPVSGGIVAIPLAEGEPQSVTVHDVQGRLVQQLTITTATRILLPPGIYIADGLKVMVK